MTFGHEFIGEIVEIGAEVTEVKVGDRVMVPFNIACGRCIFCKQGMFGNCHESNSEATAVGGISDYSHTAGGHNGGQAEYARVPYANVGPTVIPAGTDLDDAVMLTDVTPTGYQAAEMAGIQPGDTVVVVGATDNLVPIGNVLNKGLTIRGNQASVKRHLPRLIDHVMNGILKPGELITHRIPLEEVAEGYHLFSAKLDNCIKPMLIPPTANC